jgi:hypothetical protein
MTSITFCEGIVQYDKSTSKIGWRYYFRWMLYLNQGWRNAELIAQTGKSFLFEYEMPNGKQYLYEIDLDKFGYFEEAGKSVNRRYFPEKWLNAEWLVDMPDVLHAIT